MQIGIFFPVTVVIAAAMAAHSALGFWLHPHDYLTCKCGCKRHNFQAALPDS